MSENHKNSHDANLTSSKYCAKVARPGEGTPYVGRYVMLGYTWVVFEKKLYFFREMGTFFQQNFCIFSARWVSILKNISVFAKQD